MLEIASYSLTPVQLSLFVGAAMFVGMAKTGVHGAGMISVPILVVLFGGKGSTGILLSMLIFADLFGVKYYHRHADWHQLKRLIPFAFIGVVIGTLIGDAIDESLFRQIMLVTIFACLGLMIWQETSANPVIPSSFWLIASVGVIGGVTTMLGNLAGPVMGLYLLSMRLPKNQFIGTAAWFFLSINLLKIPFHVWAWETVTWDTTLLVLVTFPGIALGALLGVRIVRSIPEIIYRYFVIAMTAVAALAMI